MFRLLVVEDGDVFYEDYLLRIFKKTLPMDKITIVRAANLDQALEALPEAWDMVLMDYSMGPITELSGEPVRNGADLTRYRRVLEQTADKELTPAVIVGISSSTASNRLMSSQGADRTLSKLEAETMARLIKGALKDSE
jgi:CheY-like chemotaxis protein